MPGTLKEILQHKKNGETWFSYLAPEEYHVWQKPWNITKFRDYGVSILSIGVTSSETVKGTRNEKSYTTKFPLYLDKTGIECRGSMSTRMKRSGHFKFRVDSIIELNTALKELSDITEIRFWQLVSLEISNPNVGGICEFRRHNPDGNGTSFYLWRIENDKNSRLYPDIPFTDQGHYLGKFKQYFAACECTEALQKFHGCVLKKHEKNKKGP